MIKLNADMLYQELSKQIKIKRCGKFSDELSLGRPRLYDPRRDCEESCIYIASRDVLPTVPPAIAPLLTICLGGEPPTAWLDRGIPIFIAAETAELTAINNTIQQLFDRYEHWDMVVENYSTSAVIKDLLDCRPVDKRCLEQVLTSLQESEGEQQWQCLRLQPMEQSQTLPVDYLCLSVSEILTDSVPLVYDKGIVVLLRQTCSPAQLSAKMEPFLVNMNLIMGVSNSFTDFHRLRIYYRQACRALANGMLLNPDKAIYMLAEQALPYVLSQCVGEFTASELLPPELTELAKISQQTNINYWQTLQVYLDNEMNATKAAHNLYLHRSSMLQRLKRIKTVIGNELDCADSRLYYRICFYLIEHYGSLNKD